MPPLTKVTPAHIESYIGIDIEDADHKELYDAFCEQVVEQNHSYHMEALGSEWERESTATKEEFAEAKFDRVVSDELKPYLTLENKEHWVSATVQGIKEFVAS